MGIILLLQRNREVAKKTFKQTLNKFIGNMGLKLKPSDNRKQRVNELLTKKGNPVWLKLFAINLLMMEIAN